MGVRAFQKVKRDRGTAARSRAKRRRRRRRRVCDAPAKSYTRIHQKRTFVSPIAHTSVFSALSSILYVTYFTFPSRTLSNAGLQSSWGTTPELIFYAFCMCTSYTKATNDDNKKTRVSLERMYESPSFLFRYAARARVCVYIYIHIHTHVRVCVCGCVCDIQAH